MKKVYLFAIAGMLMSGLTLTSCSKEEGPVGPQGEQGEKGDKGDKGDQGDQGEVGTANVIYSQWMDVTFEDGIGVITAPKLDADMLNKGTVKVYVNAGTDVEPIVTPLPCILPNGDNPAIQITPFFVAGSIVLSSNYNVSSGTDEDGNKVWQYRYVLIPGGVIAKANIDWNNYSEVKKFVGIK